MLAHLLFRRVYLLLVPVLLVAAYMGVLQAERNFHESVKGELYRSAQLTPQELTAYVQRYGIKSIINLRGGHPGEAWYDGEVGVAENMHLTYINHGMSAKRTLTTAQIASLIDDMRRAPKPLLIHCKSGADRTGLASALYLAAIDKDDEWDSELQLSMFYGHVPWIGRARAMNDTFEGYEPKLGFFDS